MSGPRGFGRIRVSLAIGLVVATALVVGIAAPANADDDYPTWADVLAAKKNEKLKKAEITKIERVIAGLEATDASLAKNALEVDELYNQAADALAKAKTKADELKKESDAAAATAETSRQQAAALVSQLARSGGQDVTLSLLFDSAHASDFLWSLGTMKALNEHSGLIYQQAIADRNAAKSLADQAKVAETARAKLATAATTAKNRADSASAAASASLKAQKARSSTLYDQLASLKGTTSATEKAYEAGVAWEKAQAAVKNPPVAPPVNDPPAAPSGDAVAGAIAFARAQLGDPYKLGGSGPDVWDCSGLTKAAYASVGVYIGTHSATNQYATMASEQRLLPLSGLQAGDLLFYSNGGSTSGTKYHTALYIGNGQMIEAPYPGVSVRVANIRYGDLVPYAGRPTP